MSKVSSNEIDINDIIKPYISRWKWFIISIFLMLVLSILYIKKSVPIFRAETTVLIKDAKKMSAASGDIGVLSNLGGLTGMGTNSIENELGVFSSKSIVEDVLKKYNFQTPIFAKQTLNSIELYGKSNPYIIHVIKENNEEDLPKNPIELDIKGDVITLSSKEWDKNINSTFNRSISLPFALIMITKNPKYIPSKKIDISKLYFFYNSFEDTVDNYQQQLSVDLLDKEGTIINLSVNFENQDKAKDFLNGLVYEYNFYAINDKNIESQKTKDFIDKRIYLISKELGDVESRKSDFKANNNVVDLATEAMMNLQLKEQSKAGALEIGTQLELNNILLSTINKKGNGDVLPFNIGLNNEAAVKSIQDYNTLVLQRNKMLESATPDNPLVKDINNQIYNLKSSLQQTLQKNAVGLQLSKSKIEGQLGGSEEMISKIPNQEKLFRSIERQLQIKENLYLLLLQKREEAAISMEMTSEKARIIDKAFIIKRPVSPKKVIILGFACFLGLLIPFGWIYIKELLQSKILRRSDITKITQLPVIAEIPKLKRNESNLVNFNDVSPMAEAFRILVTNLKFLLPKETNTNIIMVTSTIKGEGKTFISSNLSIILGSVRDKVLVVGADVRNPQLQRYNPSMREAKGLTEFLNGDVQMLNEIIYPSGFNENCDFIYSGSIPPNPTDLLVNGKLDELLNQLKSSSNYKYIILDTAPLLLVTDSFLIADKCDGIVYVTRSEVTELSYINFLNENVESNKLRNVSIVLNGVLDNNFGYGNKFGYGYHADEKKWWEKLLSK